MTTDVSFACKCGKVRGVATDVSPASTNRVVCYCADCQAFARFLERSDVLDPLGGTDVVHMASRRVRITEGESAVRCVRLSSKGLFRWYTDCCRTPIANTIGGRVPVVGVIHAFMALDAAARDATLGKPIAFLNGASAMGGMPAHASGSPPFRMIAHLARLALGWWITGKGVPSPFFDTKTGAPRIEPRVLSTTERDALRPPTARRA
jgi:Family of unknown function (DUF6151)